MATRSEGGDRSTKPVRIPSVRPVTGAHPVVRSEHEADENDPEPGGRGGGSGV